VVAEQPVLSFAGLLRQLRAEAGLTQEELAEAASVSPRSVSDLERGITRTSHKDTALLLAGALGLDEPVREVFVAAARGKAPAADVLATRQGVAPGAFAAAATRGLPRDIGAFTGRQGELTQLLDAIDSLAADGGVVGIHAIDGMAGIGKTTFAVHAAHQLAGMFPDGQFFLPLHAHTAGQRPVDPADGLASLLLTAGVPAAAIPPGLQARAGRWRDQLAGRKVLLVLDDAASHEQVRPLLPGTAGSLVLVTSRRRLTALEDAAVISLDTLPAGEAAALLARLAGRPDLGAETGPGGQITRLCGYLPLAIGMIASQLRHHPAWPAADLAAELAAAKDRLELMHAENLSVAAAFGLSYADLTPGPQRLFRHLGLVPGPSVDGYAAAALDGTSLGQARRYLGELYDQHLIAEPAPGRYQLHDLLREHARTLAANGDAAESDAATVRLLDYYLHTAAVAGRHFPSWAGYRCPPPGRPCTDAPDLSTPGQAATWLEAEHANLDAAVSYAATSGRPVFAMSIPTAIAGFLDLRGHWHQALALHRTALAAARQAGDRPAQAHALNQLGFVQTMTGDYSAAATSHEQALALARSAGDQFAEAEALVQLGFIQKQTGDYPAATASAQQALELSRGLGHRLHQAWALNDLGVVQRLTGDYPAATTSAQQAVELFCDVGHRSGQVEALINLGIVQRLTGDYPAAATTLQQAQALNRDPSDHSLQLWVCNEIGVLQRLTGDYPAAAASHQQAIEQSRELGDPTDQATALNALGLVQQLTGDFPAAAASHQQALRLLHSVRHERAQVLNSLGELASRTSATQQARDYHSQALAIARDIGAPLEEARALEGIGHSHLYDGNPGQAAEYLRQALAIYQRIGASGAQHVQETLHTHGLASTTPEPQQGAPSSDGHQPRTRTAPSESQ
jgi:tetratricopeptide (TPR) repeat protein/transcriptional regulator with XRE-family HTH domain